MAKCRGGRAAGFPGCAVAAGGRGCRRGVAWVPSPAWSVCNRCGAGGRQKEPDRYRRVVRVQGAAAAQPGARCQVGWSVCVLHAVSCFQLAVLVLTSWRAIKAQTTFLPRPTPCCTLAPHPRRCGDQRHQEGPPSAQVRHPNQPAARARMDRGSTVRRRFVAGFGEDNGISWFGLR